MNKPDITKIIDGLGAKPYRGGYYARCPSHKDKRPSLSVTEKGGKVLLHCHSGCSGNDVIDALKNMGLWPDTPDRPVRPVRARTQKFTDGSGKKKIRKVAVMPSNAIAKAQIMYSMGNKITIDDIKNMWSSCTDDKQPIIDYLKSRGLSGDHVPAYAKWNPGEKSMVNPYIGLEGSIISLHRTIIGADKRSLGAMKNGVIHLQSRRKSVGEIAVTEGIENGLAWTESTGMPAVSSGNAANIRNVCRANLPIGVHTVHLLEDHDLPNKLGVIQTRKYYDDAVKSWIDDGLTVYRHHPDMGTPEKKCDWLDVFNKDPDLLNQSLLKTLPETGMGGGSIIPDW